MAGVGGKIAEDIALAQERRENGIGVVRVGTDARSSHSPSKRRVAMKARFRFALAAVAVLGVPSASGQVLNLSHDLVPLGIAAENMTPNNPGLDARPLLNAGTNYAVIHNIPLVTVDKGDYYLLTDQ